MIFLVKKDFMYLPQLRHTFGILLRFSNEELQFYLFCQIHPDEMNEVKKKGRRLTSLPKKSKVLPTLINYRKRSYFKSKLKWICFFDYILWGHDESPAWKNNSQLIPELQGEIIGVSSEIESQFCQNFIENFEESSSVELQEEIRYYFSDMNLTANYKFHWFLKKKHATWYTLYEI